MRAGVVIVGWSTRVRGITLTHSSGTRVQQWDVLWCHMAAAESYHDHGVVAPSCEPCFVCPPGDGLVGHPLRRPSGAGAVELTSILS
jgi:hypothetical protein